MRFTSCCWNPKPPGGCCAPRRRRGANSSDTQENNAFGCSGPLPHNYTAPDADDDAVPSEAVQVLSANFAIPADHGAPAKAKRNKDAPKSPEPTCGSNSLPEPFTQSAECPPRAGARSAENRRHFRGRISSAIRYRTPQGRTGGRIGLRTLTDSLVA